MTDKDRQMFEAWAKDHGWDIRRIDNPSGFVEFISHDTMQIWLGWKAAAAYYAPKLTEAEAVSSAVSVLDALDDEGSTLAHRRWAEEVLRAAGIKFKDEP